MNGLQHDLLHDLLAFQGRMHTIFRQVSGQSVSLIFHRGMIINVCQTILIRILLDPFIELDNLIGRMHTRSPRKNLSRQYGAENLLDMICLRQFCHRDQVPKHVFQGDHTVIVSDIIDSRQDHHGFRFQVNNVLAKTN